jgi:hypothetical protein
MKIRRAILEKKRAFFSFLMPVLPVFFFDEFVLFIDYQENKF